MKKFFIILCSVAFLSGCKTTVETDEVDLHGDDYGVELHDQDNDNQNDTDFCPSDPELERPC